MILFVGCSENQVTRSKKVYLPPLCLIQSETYLEASKNSPQTVFLANSDCSEMLTYTPSVSIELIPIIVDLKKACPAPVQNNPNQSLQDILAPTSKKDNPKKPIQISIFRIRMTPTMNTQTEYFEKLKTEFPKSKVYLNETTNGFEVSGLPKSTQFKVRTKTTLAPQLFANDGAEVVTHQLDYCKTTQKSEWVNLLISELEKNIQVTHVYMYGKFKIATPTEAVITKGLLPPSALQLNQPTPSASESAATAFTGKNPNARP